MLVASNLLLALIVLEIMGFIALLVVSLLGLSVASIDILVLILFRIFVIEGVVALSGLIVLVNFLGSDYLRASSFVKF